MDISLLVAAAASILVLIVLCTVFLGRKSQTSKEQDGQPRPLGRPVRRAAGQRIARRRMQANVNYQVDDEENGSGDDASDEGDDKPEFPSGKVGAKKRAKLAAKAEKKVQREAAEREREERKKREQMQQEERDKLQEKERAEEQRKEEEEKKERERKEQEEYEEYLRMKEAFSVEEEGFDQGEMEDEENLLQEFLSYIKENKVVVLEDLAAHFGMKGASVVERIQELQANGTLTGVIDDRGKFIYISQKELEAVAKFVRQRGRVSISELVESSNQLINLNPNKRTMVEAT